MQEIGNALADPAALTFDRFVAEVKKRGPRRAGLSAAAVQRLQLQFQGTTGELGTIAVATRSAELVASEAALEAYGLDRADLDVMLATAPPRMPGAAPIPVAQST